MKSDYMSNDAKKAELFLLASQLYVRLRRITGRVVDAVYMVENEAYAREIIRIALAESDSELQKHAAHLQQLINGEPASVAPPVSVRQQVIAPVVAKVVEVAVVEQSIDLDSAAHVPEEVSHHYIGALR